MRLSKLTLPLLATAAVAPALAPAAAGAATLKPPVITEKFTPLPCGGAPANRTTIQMEGCAERQLLSRDKTIDSLSRQVFTQLKPGSAQRAFVTSANQWLGYRTAFCATASSEFAGGTQAPVVDAQCDVTLDIEHIADLRTLLQDH